MTNLIHGSIHPRWEAATYHIFGRYVWIVEWNKYFLQRHYSSM